MNFQVTAEVKRQGEELQKTKEEATALLADLWRRGRLIFHQQDHSESREAGVGT